MFEWLENELSAVKTTRFHLVEGDRGPELQDVVLGATPAIPMAYKMFVLKFGSAKLFRADLTGYRIGVFASPRTSELPGGHALYNIGFEDDARIFFKQKSGAIANGVFAYDGKSELLVSNCFEDWLRAAYLRARKHYGKRKWAAILRGPPPFTPAEESIVEARRSIDWMVLGINEEGNHVFRITNSGKLEPPAAITVGIRSKDRRLNGAVRLETANVHPGQSVVLAKDCYKKLKPPEELEAFPLPDPKPEDRDYYWEFSALTKQRS